METKRLKLVSLDGIQYPYIEVECQVIDDMKSFTACYIEELSEIGIEPQKAQKTSQVYARKGIIGEEVDTRP